ncbi:Transcription factor SOX-4 [Psilocybe cubensis]|uniref:HMG box domain-containing protein n=2 Tax=Psilocybe cubensis TaxID=181762 RepID=A0A8H8CLN3_PSICU|nr:Transcription factor SOX-4 [Psilocybe cubensis]KAH9483072.1 Transcription factor SOX-4 [Psilocybe cubensis]
MSFSFGVAPNSLSGQFFDDSSFTCADRDATLSLLGHEGAIPSLSQYSLASSGTSGIDASFSVPPRRPSSRRREPGHIPRPRNAFIFFRSWYINNMHESKDVKQNELSKQAGEIWKNMSVEEKEPFLQYAAIEKEHHYAMFPDYVYSPNTTTATNKKASKYKVSRATSNSVSREASSTSWNHIGEVFHSVGSETLSPFHDHIEHVSNQQEYQQYTQNTSPAYLPVLPHTWFNKGLDAALPDTTNLLSPNSSSYPLSDTPLPLTYDNPYLGFLDYTFPEVCSEADGLMQQFMDDSMEWLELTTPVLGFSANFGQ